MIQLQVEPIGKVKIRDGKLFVELEPKYIPGLTALDGFSHLNVFWWFSEFDTDDGRNVIEAVSPYKNSPEVMGIFATRSPLRPNPIALSVSEIVAINYKTGTIQLSYIDAHDDTPVIDLKPYTPSADRIEHPQVPDWCSHWPKSVETSGDFDWEDVFNF